MDSVKLNSFDIITEASTMEFVNESVSEHDLIDSIMNIHENLNELEEDILYTKEMIPVIKVNEFTIVVDHSDLIKLMESYIKTVGVCDEERAIQILSEYYSIPMNNIYILIESEDNFKSTVDVLLEKIKKEKDPIKKNKLRSRLNNINSKMKSLSSNTNINLMKKKNKYNK